MFNRYPKFIVDYQVQERERIRQEELQYLRERYSMRSYNCKHDGFEMLQVIVM